VTLFSLGGKTDLDDMALLCWTHHRQADLNRVRLRRRNGRWTATPNPRWKWRDPRRAKSKAA
jgi:hypothetical protein